MYCDIKGEKREKINTAAGGTGDCYRGGENEKIFISFLILIIQSNCVQIVPKL